MINQTQGLVPDNTLHAQETDVHALGGFRTRNPEQASGHRPIPYVGTNKICWLKTLLVKVTSGGTHSCCSVMLHGAV